MSKKNDYEVGFGKPPKEHQFKTRRSGNPKGRPAGAKNAGTIVRELLDQKVEIRHSGKVRKLTVKEAMFLRCVDDALKGNLKALVFLLDKYKTAKRSEVPRITRDMSPQQAMELYARTIREDWPYDEEE